MEKIDIRNSRVFSNLLSDVQYVTNNINELGVEGYFSNTPGYSDYTLGSLDSIKSIYYTRLDTRSREPYCADGIGYFSYFIPKSQCKFMEKKKKKLRPYKTLEEFPGGIGSVLTYRSKSNPSVHILTSVHSIATLDNDLVYVYMDGLRLTPLHLLTDYEYLNAKGDEWLPFGVKNA